MKKWRTAMAEAAIDETKERRFLLNWSRRAGKSSVMCVVSVEECIRRPKMIVVYAAPTQEMAREIVMPLMRGILENAPEGLVSFSVQSMRWTFRNGSTIKLAGCDGLNANRLRGRAAHLAIVDEAGFVDDLTYVVESVLRPQLTTTKGAMVIASTPAESPVHPFTIMAQSMEGSEDYDACTLDEAEHVPQSEKDKAVRAAGGRGSPTCEREYFCALDVTDVDKAIVPEFQAHRSAIVVKEWPTPEFRDRYVAADFGFHDLTAVLFAYLDFDKGKLVIEDELIFQGKSAHDVGEGVKRKEAEIWKGAAPVLRVADSPKQQLYGLAQTGGVYFAPASKFDAEASLNMLRRVIAQERVVILEKCKTTIAHLHYGVWNKPRTAPDKDFARQEGMGHFDAIDAAKYLVRHVDWGKMPERPPPKRHDDLFIMRDKRNDLASQLRRRQ